jgi:hypothetical protein
MSSHSQVTRWRELTEPDGRRVRVGLDDAGKVWIKEELSVPAAILAAQRAEADASKQVEADRQAAEEATRLAALDKLRALGLTDEEIRALKLSS